MAEAKKTKVPFNLKLSDFIFIVVYVVACLVIITVPLWGGSGAIGIYPVYFIIWLIVNIATAVMHLFYVFVIKKGGDDDVD